jgi:hypothetical protein
MYPQTMRGIALIAQHAMRGIDPENTRPSVMDIQALDQVNPNSAVIMPTLDRIHKSFGITTDGTKDSEPIYVRHSDLSLIVYSGATRALDLLRDSAGWHSLNHRGPFVSAHTPAPKLQELLLAHPAIRQDVSTEMDSRAAKVLAASRDQQMKVASDHRQKLSKST